MADYIERETAIKAINDMYENEFPEASGPLDEFYTKFVPATLRAIPAADVAEVVRCKDCKHSTLPSEQVQRYGKPGTLTCHNRYAPCNRRNVGENDFCSYGEMA